MSPSILESSEIFKALGDPTRLKILKIISNTNGAICVGKIAGSLSVSQPAVSQHLKILKNAKLIFSEKDGFFVHHYLNKNCLDCFDVDIVKLLKTVELPVLNKTCCDSDNSKDCTH